MSQVIEYPTKKLSSTLFAVEIATCAEILEVKLTNAEIIISALVERGNKNGFVKGRLFKIVSTNEDIEKDDILEYIGSIIVQDSTKYIFEVKLQTYNQFQ
ncbi:MAG: hypothetical protein GY828_05040 [Candidatus Gracilibacteria bacterium]|nr:hypothetical protein [Candidatus Gracilibacteria bacterium]